MNTILGLLALLSLLLLLWQWVAGLQFPLHQRAKQFPAAPGVTLLKSLKGCDPATGDCLRSWMIQDYAGPVQILFAVAAADDPVCQAVRALLAEFPAVDAQLIVCGPLTGTNSKVAKLIQIERLARHELLVISDADVKVPPDFLQNVLVPLAQPEVGLVNCFYCLANPSTPAMQWEAVAINADFWSQVLQAENLKPLDFALGAVMSTRRQQLKDIGGLAGLADCLADDYQLGNRIARGGHRIVLSPVVVECWSRTMDWAEVWKHQLRWARTVRVCQPLPYFFSILSNPTVWPLVWLVVEPSSYSLAFFVLCLLARILTARHLQHRLLAYRSKIENQKSKISLAPLWLAPLKDLLQTAIWLGAFLGNRIEWAGRKMTLRPDGTLQPITSNAD